MELLRSTIIRIVCLLSVFVVLSCSDSGNSKSWKDGWNEADSTYVSADEELLPDTMNGEVVSHECAEISYDLDQIIAQLQAVRSPSMLINVRKQYPSLMENASAEASKLSSAENDAISEKQAQIEELYIKVCRAYEVEAAGVIANLNRCMEELNEVKDSTQMKSFLSYRYATIRNLESSHLCVDQRSPRIGEIKRTAQKLDAMAKKKLKEFNIQL